MGMILQPELSMEMQRNGNVFNVAVCPLHNLGTTFGIKQRKYWTEIVFKLSMDGLISHPDNTISPITKPSSSNPEIVQRRASRQSDV